MTDPLAFGAIVEAVAAGLSLPRSDLVAPARGDSGTAVDGRTLIAVIASRHSTAGMERIRRELGVGAPQLQHMLRRGHAWLVTRPDFLEMARRTMDRLLTQTTRTADLDEPIPDEVAAAVRSALSTGCSQNSLIMAIRQQQAAIVRAGAAQRRCS